jgi:AcrR family transcriptional regulator
LKASDASRGSIYHHFPRGKNELVEEAIDFASQRALAALGERRGQPAVQIIDAYLEMWRQLLERAQFRAGCAVLAVSIDTDSTSLRRRAGSIFFSWRTTIADLLEVGGLSRSDASQLSATLISATEGAVAIARAEGDMAVFDLVASNMVHQARAFSRSHSTS